MKQISSEFLEEIQESSLEPIKQEFQGKTFEVSQKMIWKNGQTSYENQLKNFQNLANLIESKVDQLLSEQKSLVEKSDSNQIDSSSLKINEEDKAELKALLTEIILEGLRHTSPKILERKEAGYVSA